MAASLPLQLLFALLPDDYSIRLRQEYPLQLQFTEGDPSQTGLGRTNSEKSWGGEQIGTHGNFIAAGLPVVIPQPDMSLARDDFLRGHFQFQVPLAQDFAIAGDVFHDFQATGGFKENIGVEIRLSKFFFPPSRTN